MSDPTSTEPSSPPTESDYPPTTDPNDKHEEQEEDEDENEDEGPNPS